MDELQGRVLQMASGRKSQNQKPLKEYVILLPNGRQIRQKAHDWSEVTAEAEDSVSALCIAFYVDKHRVLSIPWDHKISVMDAEYCDVDAAIAALKAPTPRKPARKKKEA